MEGLDSTTTVQELKMIMEKFVKDRDWEKFHTPRNIATSISIEAAELLEIYQWDLDEQQTYEQRGKAEEELADVLAYCLSMANELGIDIVSSFKRKMELNKRRYPAAKFKGAFHKPEREREREGKNSPG